MSCKTVRAAKGSAGSRAYDPERAGTENVKEKLSAEDGSGRHGLGVETGQLTVGAGVGAPVCARETCSSVGICVE
jgi:hypothetical protein